MEINWTIIGIVTALAAILIVFLIWRNRKDEENLERFLNENELPGEENKEEEELNDLL